MQHCQACPNTKIFARRLCQACYYRQRRNGTTDRKNVINDGACSFEGCERQSFSRNLCGLHYQRSKHKLWRVWSVLRSRAQGAYPPAWDQFELFLAAVGERPSPKHQLRRKNPALPWSAENLIWQVSVGVPFRGNIKDYQWRWHLRNRYGITVERVEEMAQAQGGQCAICPAALGATDPKTDKPSKVCVDHDHVTRQVRGLLCDPCNKALGLMLDNPSRFRAAALYLDQHAASTGELSQVRSSPLKPCKETRMGSKNKPGREAKKPKKVPKKKAAAPPG